jgi:hypothetical protein
MRVDLRRVGDFHALRRGTPKAMTIWNKAVATCG